MWKSIRQFLNDIHLYAGLTCGLIVIAVCLSGTLYVYNTEIREFFDSERYFVEKESKSIPLDELRATLETQLGGQVVGFQVFGKEGRTHQFSLKKTGEEKPITYFVNPYSGAVLADNTNKTATETFMGSLFSLHRWLLLDKVETPIIDSMSNQDLGRLINGIATSLFLLGVMTGIFLWFPKKAKNWKQGLKVKWDGNWKRINHDLHNTLAFYSLIALFIMAVTGPFWSFGWYKTGWQKTWDTYQAPKEEKKVEPAKDANSPILVLEDSTQVSETVLISLDEAMATATKHLTYAGVTKLTFPEDAEGDLAVSKSRTGFFARAGADQLKLNAQTLELKEKVLFAELPVRQQIGKSVKALHTGEIFGQFTKFLWAVACAIATSLPITGTMIWLNKRKKKRGAKGVQKAI